MNIRDLVCIALLVGSVPSNAQQRHMKIWYDQPAPVEVTADMAAKGVKAVAPATKRQLKGSVWENYSLPLGNSSLGVTLLQAASVDRMVINEKSLWKGGPNTGSGPATYWHMNPNSARHLPEIRQAYLDGKDHKADSLTRIYFSGPQSEGDEKADTLHFGTFTPMGECFLQMALDENESRDFYRDLSIDDAVSHVSFTNGGVKYRRSYFVSYPDQVYVVRLEANKCGKQTFEWFYQPHPHAAGVWKVEQGALVYTAKLNNNGLEYAIRVKAVNKGGKVEYGDGRIKVKGADRVDLIFAAATSYVINKHPDFADPFTYYGQDPVEITRQRLANATQLGYKGLLDRHVVDYRGLYSRLSLSLNPDEKFLDMPTDKRIDAYRTGNADSYLETLYYQFGRYMVIASSRGATLPANLQGLWANDLRGPWNVDYHNNINIQMNYWPVCSANLSECFQPLVEYLQMIYEPGKRTAKAMYDARGWTANISTNIYGFTGPSMSGQMEWNLAAINGPWLATHLWEYYDYTRDIDYLRNTAYPLLAESARFVADYLWLQPNGRYTAAPSCSPEHGPIDRGATFANAVAAELLADVIKASEILGADAAERAEWQRIHDNIEPYCIGRYGQLMEWSKDIDDPNDNHRHTNHLFGVFPGNTISPVTTPALAEAAKVVLNHRGDVSTGWSMGWKINHWAHLLDGNRAYKLVQDLLRTGTLYNLWDTHPPFQIDGNFGGVSGINEMLVQSNLGYINLLAACPDAWKKGEVRGIRVKGNCVLDLSWDFSAARSVKVTLYPQSDGKLDVRFGEQSKVVDAKKSKVYKVEFSL